MDHKTWLWRKKSSEKTIVVIDKANFLSKGKNEEAHVVDKEVEWERSLKNLNEKLSAALSECSTKDDLVTKHAKAAEDAIAGWEKAESKATSLKQELDKALQQRVATEERLAQIDGALKECMQQLRFVREEQEKRIHDAITKTSKEFEKERMDLEDKLVETNENLAKLGAENTQLSKALLVKEKLIEELNASKSQVEADYAALIARLNSIEKGNSSLKYEVRVLEKELEIRNEEREFNRRSADASHKQHLESVKKIAKLETECQRLRLLVQKRLPGPAALAKMKNEVEMLGRDPTDQRRSKSSPPMAGPVVGFVSRHSPDAPSKRINFLVERLCSMDEENKALKEALIKKDSELQSSRIMYAHTASKLSQVEAQLGILMKGQKTMVLSKNSSIPNMLSVDSTSGIGNDDELSCAESWASALISELEHFRNEKPKTPLSCKSVGISDLSLMDDFIEMERLAIVSVDTPLGNSLVSSDESNAAVGPLGTESAVYPSDAAGKELVPVMDSHSGFCYITQKTQPNDASLGKYPHWLQDILKVVLEQNLVTGRSFDEILKEVRVALTNTNNSNPSEAVGARKSSSHSGTSDSDPQHISGYISWRPPNNSLPVDSFDESSGISFSSKENADQKPQSNLNKSISRLIELIEGISQPSLMDYSTPQILAENDGNSLPYKNSATPTGYMVRIFQWKSPELTAVLQNFVNACYDLLNGKIDLENFARELTSALEWVTSHCFSLQDVSSMRDTIRKHFDWDDARSETEHENGSLSETDKIHSIEEPLPCLPLVGVSNGDSNVSKMEKVQSVLNEENRRLKDELKCVESVKKDLELRLQSATEKSESLMNQIHESRKDITSLQAQLETLRESKGTMEDQIENNKLANEDLDAQLKVARVELNESHKRFPSLKLELEDKRNCCVDLEATCHELELQLESVTKKENPKHDPDQEEKQFQTDREITAASEKLAECQETILNLGKQLKALASPREAAMFDKVFSSPITTTENKNMSTNHRSSLLDQMLAEDDVTESPTTKEVICTGDANKLPSHPSNNSNSVHGPIAPVKSLENALSLKKTKHKNETTTVEVLAIVPIKKRTGGSGLLRKLLLRRKRGNKKASNSVAVVS
ncbi:PREDICTED: filament-like plant protein 7 [Nelumbo nucifera]|uniref:Filament-like plant protein 7 n=2 Tax=Nelumbo nucifera TaxID=4432 RepID=A0A1U8ALC6_NELNU|nr:PREDICTED: filament-like plant protein 7 [Nelumbo nucifera]XP_010263479.1 PREDICTED: filament-like plant protein 7 [Nelumbo nucifera]XP_019054072.1 PREDICTED: filament-like plant protein 7 [Nelumbo nucifera]DAD21499.1 TPA_asm: hypothetical protein HUJ06_022962 [Nelumbo nucifera]